MLNWKLYNNHFSSMPMRDIWSEKSTISGWLKTEQDLAICQAGLDIIPQESAEKISKLSIENFDHNSLADDMILAGRPIVGLIKQMREFVGEECSKHVHFGTTTQDIVDTTMVLQIKQSLVAINQSIDKICTELEQLMTKHSDTVMIGRTNNQHALPIKFNSKLQVWLDELKRRQAAIYDAKNRGLLIQIGGPVGDLSAYGDKGVKLKKTLADYYGIGYTHSHWQNARDGIAEIISAIGLLSSTLVKIAQNVSLLSSSDIAELNEQREKGKGASSSMLHKQNQRCSEFAEAVARLARQRAEQINESSVHQHERSGNVWISEWVIVPEVFLLCSGALVWTQCMLENLEIDTEKMKSNLEKSLKNIVN